jgi:hypothetical protein
MTTLPTGRSVPTPQNSVSDGRCGGQAVQPNHVAAVECLDGKLPFACVRIGKQSLGATSLSKSSSGRDNRPHGGWNTRLTHGVFDGGDTLAIVDDQAREKIFLCWKNGGGHSESPLPIRGDGAKSW